MVSERERRLGVKCILQRYGLESFLGPAASSLKFRGFACGPTADRGRAMARGRACEASRRAWGARAVAGLARRPQSSDEPCAYQYDIVRNEGGADRKKRDCQYSRRFCHALSTGKFF